VSSEPPQEDVIVFATPSGMTLDGDAHIDDGKHSHMKTIQIDRDVYSYLLSKASPAGEAVSLTLRRELHVPEPKETVEIDDDTYNFLLSKAVNIGESPSDILRRELHLDDVHPHDAGAVIVFHIPPGTGNQPWNTAATAVQAAVGDTLRIVNDDAIAHRLHTGGNPFPHQDSDIAPGQSADFVLQTPFEGQPLYDHNAGPGALFWITVREVH
jgi:negative regulator of replication initiation